MSNRKAQNGIRYSDRQKAAAVETVKAAGGKVTDQILADVRLLLNSRTLSFNSLNNWVKTARKMARKMRQESTSFNPSDTEVEVEGFDSRATAVEMWQQTRIAYLRRANDPDAVKKTDGKDAVAAAERAQRTEQLLQGLPTQIVAVIPELVDVIKRKGYDPVAALQTMKTQFAALPDAPMITEVHSAN